MKSWTAVIGNSIRAYTMTVVEQSPEEIWVRSEFLFPTEVLMHRCSLELCISPGLLSLFSDSAANQMGSDLKDPYGHASIPDWRPTCCHEENCLFSFLWKHFYKNLCTEMNLTTFFRVSHGHETQHLKHPFSVRTIPPLEPREEPLKALHRRWSSRSSFPLHSPQPAHINSPAHSAVIRKASQLLEFAIIWP